MTGGSSPENGDVTEGGGGGGGGLGRDWSRPPSPSPLAACSGRSGGVREGRGSSSSGWRRWHLRLDFSRHPRLTRHEFPWLIGLSARARARYTAARRDPSIDDRYRSNRDPARVDALPFTASTNHEADSTPTRRGNCSGTESTGCPVEHS